MTIEERKVAVLSIQLDEWRRKLDAVDRSYDRIRGRSISLLTIQLGIGGYFVSQLNMLIEPELQSKIFFVMGGALVIVAIAYGIQNYRTKKHWLSPMYELEIEKMNNVTLLSSAYSILVADYKDAYDNNLAIHEPAARRLNHSLFIFIAGAIILVVLNFT